MTDQDDEQQSNPFEESVEQERRDFLRSLGKWSQAVIGGVLLGGAAASNPAQADSWVNRPGGGWYNRGGGWYNRPGGSWYNRHGGWVNRHGGGWYNRHGGWLTATAVAGITAMAAAGAIAAAAGAIAAAAGAIAAAAGAIAAAAGAIAVVAGAIAVAAGAIAVAAAGAIVVVVVGLTGGNCRSA